MGTITRAQAKQIFKTKSKPQQQDFHDLFDSIVWMTEIFSSLSVATQTQLLNKDTRTAVSPSGLWYIIDTYIRGGQLNDQENTMLKLAQSITALKQWKDSMTQADTDNIVNTITEIVDKFNGLPEDGQTLFELIASKANIGDAYTKSEADNTFPTKAQLNTKEDAILNKNTAFNKNFAARIANANRANGDLVARAIDSLPYRGTLSNANLNNYVQTQHAGIYTINSRACTNAPQGAYCDWGIFVVIPANDHSTDGQIANQMYVDAEKGITAYRCTGGGSLEWQSWKVYRPAAAQLLAMGRVGALGNTINGSGFTCNKTSTGTYTINHGSNTSNIEVMVTGYNVDNIFSWSPVDNNNIRVITNNINGTPFQLEDASFSFQIWVY